MRARKALENEADYFNEDSRLVMAIIAAHGAKDRDALDEHIEELSALHKELAERFNVWFPKDKPEEEPIPAGKIRYRDWMQKMRLRKVD
jgi:hypothetical protein